MAKLSEREVTAAEVLVGRGRSVRSAARELGVDESTLRYRLKRRREGAIDGRTRQTEACSSLEHVIVPWIEAQPWESTDPRNRPESVKSLYERLVAEHGFTGSYKAVQRFVRRRAPVAKIRPVRRVETKPGLQAQVDWGARRIYVHELGGLVLLKAFLMTLSHSRMNPVRFYENESQLSWLDAHNHAFETLGGVPITIRIDNLKTGVKKGAGAWAEVNDTYRAYGEAMGFHIDPARPRRGSDKGKVERRVRDLDVGILRPGERFLTLEDVNEATAERTLERAKRLINPVTGESVHDTWLRERDALQALPAVLPVPFDVQVTRDVSRDCLVPFEGREYCVPYPLAKHAVQVRGTARHVQIFHDGQLVKEYPRGTNARLLIDQACYDPAAVREAYPHLVRASEARVAAPTPLGRVGRAIVAERSWEAAEAARRPLSEYEALLRRAR